MGNSIVKWPGGTEFQKTDFVHESKVSENIFEDGIGVRHLQYPFPGHPYSDYIE